MASIKNSNDCGAGVWVKNGTVSWCCITNNVGGHHYSSGYGVSFSGGQGTIDHSIVADNVSASGFQGGTGAGVAVNDTTGAVTIDACLVVDNIATNNGASGAGVYVKNLGGTCTVRNCTIADNEAVSNSGGIDLGSAGTGKLVLVNTILVGNKVGANEVNLVRNNSNFDPVNSKNCFVGLASETTANIGGVNYNLTGFQSGDPKFVDPSNGDYRLQEDSPAKGSGATYDGIGNDLDGKVFATPPSMGCYENGVGDPPAPHTHNWGTPTYSWAADNSTCTATAVCTGDSSHVTNETVTASYEVSEPATTETTGMGRYTATFSSALFTVQTKDVVIPVKSAGIEPGATASATRQTIQDAIDAAAPTHGTVTLGAGLFEIDAQLNVTSGVTLVGQGWTNTVIKRVVDSSKWTVQRCVMIDGGAKVEGVVLTGGDIRAQSENGGGAWVKNGTISWCCITNNFGSNHSASGYGVSFSGGQGTIDHSVVSGNQTKGGASCYGAGIGGFDTVGPVIIDTCLIADNLLGSSGAGGGIGIKNIGGDCIVRNCTIVGNTANTHSAGIRIENRATGNSTAKGLVINTIAVNNMKSGAEVNYADNFVVDSASSSNNFFGLEAEAALFTDSIFGDPKFLAASSGDYRLSEESTAKNAGVAYSGIGGDLDGVAFAAAPSIGCYEYDPSAVPPPSPAEWDISGSGSGGIKALDDGQGGGKYIVFTSILRVGTAVTVGVEAAKVDADGERFALVCKTNLTDTATFVVNAKMANETGGGAKVGTLTGVTDSPSLFVFGIEPVE